jgi:TrmH family RNA methyltransferase
MTEGLRIESLDNDKVKDAIRLRSRRARETSNRFLVEGAREIRRALDAGHRPVSLFVESSLVTEADLIERSTRAGARSFSVSKAVWSKMAVREDRDGLLAIFPLPRAELSELQLGGDPLVLAAIGIEKPGNVGALLRTADAFGVDAFLIAEGTDLWNPNVVRASLGCVFSVPLALAEADDLLPWIKGSGLRIAAATPGGGVSPSEADLRGALALVVGSEEQGLGREILASADVKVRIAMKGSADSLNVSVAAGILLYEADQQRSAAAPKGRSLRVGQEGNS